MVSIILFNLLFIQVTFIKYLLPSITNDDKKNNSLAIILFIQQFIKIKFIKKIFYKKNIRPIKSLTSLFPIDWIKIDIYIENDK